MLKALVLLQFLFTLNLYAQEFTNLVDKGSMGGGVAEALGVPQPQENAGDISKCQVVGEYRPAVVQKPQTRCGGYTPAVVLCTADIICDPGSPLHVGEFKGEDQLGGTTFCLANPEDGQCPRTLAECSKDPHAESYVIEGVKIKDLPTQKASPQ